MAAPMNVSIPERMGSPRVLSVVAGPASPSERRTSHPPEKANMLETRYLRGHRDCTPSPIRRSPRSASAEGKPRPLGNPDG